MLIKREEIASFAKGNLGVEYKEGNCIAFRRFTKNQLDVYDKNPGFAIRARCNPGVYLDFFYDGTKIDFDFFPMKQASRSYFSIDLYADGIMVYSKVTFVNGEGQTHFAYQFNEAKKRRIQIYLPSSCGIEICNFVLSDGAKYSSTLKSERKMLLLGDSITQGFDTRYTSLCYATAVSRYFGVDALNQAIAGHFFDADTIDRELEFVPDIITVAYGTNDWGRYGTNEQEYIAAAKKFIDKLCSTYSNSKIFGITPVWRSDKKIRPERMDFEKIYDILGELYSAHSNVTLIDGRKLIPNTAEFYTDGLHPNTIGFGQYTLGVVSAIEKSGFIKG